MALTPKEQRFVEEFMIDQNQSASYIRAGYTASSNAVARVEGHRLRHKPEVSAAIEVELIALRAKTLITAERIMHAYAQLAFYDPRDLYDDEGKLLPVNELNPNILVALKEFGDGKVRLVDRKGALDSLARTMGMLKDRVEHSGPNGGPIKTEDISMVDAARRIAFMMSAAVQEIETKH